MSSTRGRPRSDRALRDVLDGLLVRQVAEAEWGAVDPTGRFAVNLNRPEDLIALA